MAALVTKRTIMAIIQIRCIAMPIPKTKKKHSDYNLLQVFCFNDFCCVAANLELCFLFSVAKLNLQNM